MAPPRRGRGAPRRSRLLLAVLLAVLGLASLGVGCGSGADGDGHRDGASSPDARTRPATEARDPSRAAAPRPAAPWTRARAMRWLLKRRVRVPGRAGAVALDGATLTCVGVGRASRVSGRAAWTRFRCVQPTFPDDAVVGPDVVFVARSTGPRALAIEGVRLTRY